MYLDGLHVAKDDFPNADGSASLLQPAQHVARRLLSGDELYSFTTEQPPGGQNAQAGFDQAAEGGMMEVAKGKLAAQKGSHEGVKQFGQRMVDDHTKANDELKTIASGKNITLPGESPKPPMKAVLAKLEKLEGAAFDRAYVYDQVRDHEKTIALFERESKGGKGAELKAFAEKTLPTLKEHLTAIRDLKSKLAKGGTN